MYSFSQFYLFLDIMFDLIEKCKKKKRMNAHLE